MSRYEAASRAPGIGIGAAPAQGRPPFNNQPAGRYSPQNQMASAPGRTTSSGTGGSGRMAGGGSPEELEQSKRIARTHYDQLNAWVHDGRGRVSETATTRTSAREKLTRLTRQQFQELSTDVYDELCRRIERGEQDGAPGNGGVPFLLSRDDFHPKRNQARQKLATLPRNRFRDLASDVFYELERRYPEFSDAEVLASPPMQPQPQQPSRPFNAPPQQPLPQSPPKAINGTPARSGTTGGIANEVVVPDKSTLVVEDDGEPDESSSVVGNTARRPLNNLNANTVSRGINGVPSSLAGGGHEDDNKSATGRSDYFDKMSIGRTSEGSNVGQGLGRFLGGIGDRSTSAGGSLADGASSIGPAHRDNREREEALDKLKSDYEYRIATMSQRISTLEHDLDDARRQRGLALDDSQAKVGQLERSVRELESELDARDRQLEDRERRLQEAREDVEAERGNRSRDDFEHKEEVSRLTRMVEDLEKEKERNRGGKMINSTSVHSLASISGSPALGDRSLGTPGGQSHAAAVQAAERLRAEVGDLLSELRGLQQRQDEMVGERERDLDTIRALEVEVAQLRKRDASRAGGRKDSLMRSFSRMAEQNPAISPNGAVLDSHFATFNTSIDALLSASRTAEAGDILSVARDVVDSTGTIDDDIQTFESRNGSSGGAGLSQEDLERLAALKVRANATLSNLVTACKNHATSLGLSPASLVDAAASHLTTTIVDLVQLVGLRQASPYDSGPSSRPVTGRAATQLSMVSETSNKALPIPVRSTDTTPNMPSASGQQRGPFGVNGIHNESSFEEESFGNLRTSPPPHNRDRYDYDTDDRYDMPPPANKYDDARTPTTGFTGSNGSGGSRDQGDSFSTSSGPAPDRVFDSPPRKAAPGLHDSNYGLGPTRSEVEEREKLRNYLESQTESIVAYIQSLLSSIRTGAQGGPPLSDTLTQIITIVSSIVAFTDDSLPQRPESDKILRELTDNCNRLSEMQGLASSSTFDKQSKQAMAAASFGVAKALKELNSYISVDDASVL